ncbi:PREDICTED: putative ribonuclease H protein At1g65750-like [Fragaria vesca subsp. vesca]
MLSLGWLQEFTTANVTPTGSIDRRQQNWSVPASGWLKCNCDGSFLANTHHGGSGVILRNEHGIFQAGASRAYVQLTSPFHAELNALLDGMRLAECLHHDRVIFETDCLMLTQALQQQDVDLSSLGDTIVDVKEIMSRHVDFRVAHIYCEANRVAHVLANHALHSSESQSWFTIAPHFIKDVI